MRKNFPLKKSSSRPEHSLSLSSAFDCQQKFNYFAILITLPALFTDVDFFSRSNSSKDHADDSAARIKRAVYAAATPQLDCTSSYDLENVQSFGGKSLVDVFAERKCILQFIKLIENIFTSWLEVLKFHRHFPSTVGKQTMWSLSLFSYRVALTFFTFD